MSLTSATLQHVLSHARAVLHEADGAIAAARALQAATGMDATQLRDRLQREGGPQAVKEAQVRVDGLMARRDTRARAGAGRRLLTQRVGRALRLRTNLV